MSVTSFKDWQRTWLAQSDGYVSVQAIRDLAAPKPSTKLTANELMGLLFDAVENLDDDVLWRVPYEHEGDSLEATIERVCQALGITTDEFYTAFDEGQTRPERVTEMISACANYAARTKGRPTRLYVVDGLHEHHGLAQNDCDGLLIRLTPNEFEALTAKRSGEVPVLLAHCPAEFESSVLRKARATLTKMKRAMKKLGL